MNYHWKEPPKLDPKDLDLPSKPRVVEFQTSTWIDPVGEEGLVVRVVFDRVTRAQEKNILAFTDVIMQQVHRKLESLGEERWPHFRWCTLEDLEIEKGPVEDW